MSNAFGGSSTSCPSCNGTGRRSVSDTVFRDVTKTKPSHHNPTSKVAQVKATAPTTFEGTQLANQVMGSSLSDDVKNKLVREIMEYEVSHGKCTQTFSKKIRKHLR